MKPKRQGHPRTDRWRYRIVHVLGGHLVTNRSKDLMHSLQHNLGHYNRQIY